MADVYVHCSLLHDPEFPLGDVVRDAMASGEPVTVEAVCTCNALDRWDAPRHAAWPKPAEYAYKKSAS